MNKARAYLIPYTAIMSLIAYYWKLNKYYKIYVQCQLYKYIQGTNQFLAFALWSYANEVARSTAEWPRYIGNQTAKSILGNNRTYFLHLWNALEFGEYLEKAMLGAKYYFRNEEFWPRNIHTIKFVHITFSAKNRYI